jgi:glycosyltransferase involved in cell wall biosynthesis
MTSTGTSLTETQAPASPNHRPPLSVCLVVSSLEFGGAERQVVEMARSFDRSRVQPHVISLSNKVPLAEFLPGNGDCLSIVEKRGRFDVSTIFRVAKVLRDRQIDVVHAFLFDADVITRLASRFTRVKLMVSSERNANYKQPRFHKLALKATQPFFDVMIANSEAGKRFGVTHHGIRASRIEVVRNGVDVKKFSPNPEAGAAIRAELGIPAGDPVVGMVGSFKFQKGHEFFLRMAAEVRKEFANAWFLVLGEVPERASTAYYQEMLKLAESLNFDGRCRFLGARTDMAAVYNSFNVMTLLSRHEGTPNVVLEAMASGVPVVATDVADNSFIIQEGATGHIVPVGDIALPAARVCALLRNPAGRSAMGEKARDHMCREFSFQSATAKMADVYDRYLALKRGRG